MAVGSTYLYTVKIKGDNSGAVLQKTNKNTGATTNLTNSTGSIYTYLNHANDMDVTTIDGYSQLFVATMATGSNSLVRIKVNGSKATKSGGYNLIYNGQQKSVSGVAVEWTDANNVYLLLKSGATVYRATVPKAATGGNINITKAFTLNTGSVKVNGSYVNLSSYTHQGMGYHDGKIYVPLWGGGAGKSNQAVIAVYDTYNASGSVKSDPFLSFRVTSGAYSGFEIKSCDISSDGQMYFNVNRWTSSSGNNDAILRFNGFVANGFNPDGYTDAIGGGRGTVTVRGWAFDKDCAAMSIPVRVYIGGPAGSGEGHAITANTYRSDVNGAFGCGNYHGFDATIETSLRGSQPVYLYAINTRKGTNVMIGSGWVNIQEKQYSIYDYGIADIGSGFYANIVNVSANKNVAIDLSNTNGNAIIYDRGANADHIWRFNRYADGSYKITNTYNGKCLDVNGASGECGANVGVWEDNGSAAQKWYIYNVCGKYVLKPACSDRVLDVYGASTANFANIQTWDFNASGAQLFTIELV